MDSFHNHHQTIARHIVKELDRQILEFFGSAENFEKYRRLYMIEYETSNIQWGGEDTPAGVQQRIRVRLKKDSDVERIEKSHE